MKTGLTLPNRGVLFGAVTVEQLLRLAELAARTERVRLGTACMGSFPLRDPVLLACQLPALEAAS